MLPPRPILYLLWRFVKGGMIVFVPQFAGHARDSRIFPDFFRVLRFACFESCPKLSGGIFVDIKRPGPQRAARGMFSNAKSSGYS